MCVLVWGTLPESNGLPLKMDGWNTTVLLGRPIFRCYVSFNEANLEKKVTLAVKVVCSFFAMFFGVPFYHDGVK